MQAKDLGHLSTPVAAADSNAQAALSAVGFKMADTILSYHLDLTSQFKPVKKNCADGAEIRKADVCDISALSKIAAQCFSDRFLNVNRFNSELLFEPERVGKLYASWLRAAILENQADLTLVYDYDGPVGFMTFKLPTGREKASGLNLGRAVLSAVDPAYHKRGAYRGLLSEGCAWLKANGIYSVEGRTQLSTVPVLRVWQGMGATLQNAYHTFQFARL